MKVTANLVSIVKGNGLTIVAVIPVRVGINASPIITNTRLIKAVFTGIFFSEIRMPTRIPVKSKLIVETHRIRSSNSLPIKLNNLRKFNNMKTTKLIETANTTFFVCIVSSKNKVLKMHIRT